MGIRPSIRPGAALLRRDREHLQIGTAPGLVICDQPGLLHVLRLFDGIRTIEAITSIARTDIAEFTGDLPSILGELLQAGVVADARMWDFPGHRELSNEARFHCATGDPSPTIGRRQTFSACLSFDAASRPLAHIASAILSQAGVSRLDAQDADLVVVFSLGEPARAIFDSAVSNDADHLMVVLDEERVRIGPLVTPGRSPCVRCYDLHRTEWDRAWPALATQFGRPHHTIITPPAITPTTLHVAAAEIASTVLAHCDSGGTASASRLVAIGPNHTDRNEWPVAFHPACACSLLHVA